MAKDLGVSCLGPKTGISETWGPKTKGVKGSPDQGSIPRQSVPRLGVAKRTCEGYPDNIILPTGWAAFSD